MPLVLEELNKADARSVTSFFSLKNQIIVKHSYKHYED
jgi:hypothetical protein